MKLNFKLINNFKNIKNSKSFLNVFILGNTISLNSIVSNFSSFKILDTFSKSLLINKCLYLTKVLRSKFLFSLNDFSLFDIFSLKNINSNVINLFVNKNSNFNTLNNNFKFFIYSLYNISNNLLYNCSSDSILLSNQNNYYVNSFSDYNSFSFVYGYLGSSRLSKKFASFNFSYLRSKKKKRFKKKQSEKLAVLRDNLYGVKNSPFRLKYYYKFFDYTKLHPYWNKEAFIKKKFQYFNPGKNSFLLHFIYQYKKHNVITDKNSLFSNKVSSNFWLQKKIKNYKISSYTLLRKKTKTNLKLKSFYLKSVLNNNNLFKEKNYLDMANRYSFKFYISHSKKFLNSFLNSNVPNNLKVKYVNSFSFFNNNLSNILNFSNEKVFKGILFDKVYNKFKTSNFSNSFYFIRENKINRKIKNFKSNKKLPSLYRYKNVYKNKKRKPYFFLNNFYSDYSKKKAFYSLSKKSKPFRVKVKYWNWLVKQQTLKSWKFNKFLIFKNLVNSNFKKNLLFLNNKKIYPKKNKFNNFLKFKEPNYAIDSFDYITKARNKIYNWVNNDLYFYNRLKSSNFRYFFKSINYISNKYVKNFSFYRSNKLLNKNYAYHNLFKGFRIFKKNKKFHFFLSKLSNKVFKKSWNHVKLNYYNKGKKSLYHLNNTPSFNQLFIKKVLKLYRSSFFSLLMNSTFIKNKHINFSVCKKYFKSYSNKNLLYSFKPLFMDNMNLDMLKIVKHSRSIDRTYGFNKRREKLFNSNIKKLKSKKNAMHIKFSNFLNGAYQLDHSNLDKLKKSFNNEVSSLDKHISIIKNDLSPKVSFKKGFNLNYKSSQFFSFKNNLLRYNSLYNYLQSIKLQNKNNSFDYFLKSLTVNNTSFLSSLYLKGSLKFRRRHNSKSLLKGTKVYSISPNALKKNLSFLNKIFIYSKVSRLNNDGLLKNKLSLNNLLKKNYNSYLKVFKYFTLYKKASTLDYFLGFGKLWNYCNVNNNNIFSFFNFINYNFYDFKNKKNVLNDYFGNLNYFNKNSSLKALVGSNLVKIKSLFPLDSEEKLKEFYDRCTTPVIDLFPSYDLINKSHKSTLLNYDIINKSNSLSRVIYTKNFLFRYSSVLNISLLPFLLRILGNNKVSTLIRYSITSRYKLGNILQRDFIYNSLDTENTITNLFMINNYINSLNSNSGLVNKSDKPFKKLYYSLLNTYNNILL